MNFDLRRIQYFVEVAEQQSFVRAATRLHMTQPALSRQIAGLETDLGVTLFARSRSGSVLTDEGAILLKRARVLLATAADFERDARLLGRAPARFVVGFMPGVDASALIEAFRRRQPNVNVTPIFTSITTQAPYLIDGRADVVFCRPPIGAAGACIVDLFDEPIVAAFRHDHPLATRKSLRLSDLADLNEPVLKRQSVGNDFDGRAEEFDPQDALLSVSAGMAVALLPAGIAAFYAAQGVRYVPVKDAPPQIVALAYYTRRAMPHIDDFAALCRDELGPHIRDLPEQLAGGNQT